MKHIENARKLRPIVEQAMQFIDGNDALTAKMLYPTFYSIIGQTVKNGFKFTHADRLWQTIQPEMTIQSHYTPGTGTESLYTEVCETHDGSVDDPIPYNGNMALTANTHYSQNGVIYLCTRDTVNPVYSDLSDLVGVYLEVV